MKRVFLGIMLILLVCSLYSAWLNDVPIQVEQTDGTIINCFATGDEFHNWAHDKEGYTIIQHPKTGDYVWAIYSGTDVKASDYRIDLFNPSTLNIPKYVNISEERYREKSNQYYGSRNYEPSRAPTYGTINNIVVFIRFAGDAEYTQNISTYNDMFNKNDVNTANSMKRFFYEVSYENLTVNTTFYPAPANNIVVSYQDTNNRNYYSPHSATNATGYADDDERTTREHTLLKRAIEHVAASVPANLAIDGDNDGKVDNVCFIVKGGTTAWNTLLWPHQWSLFSYTVNINGKRVYGYNFQLEADLGADGNSVLCHEMFHSLGAPDLYRYVGTGNPIGVWDLMAHNTTPNPQHMSMYMKYRYGHWVPIDLATGIPEIRSAGTYTLSNNKVNTNNNWFKIRSPYKNSEYFVVEFRKNNNGNFDSNLPGSGLLVYRVNENADGNGNRNGPPDELYVYRPGGTLTANGTINDAFYSSQSGRTSLNDTTNPKAFLSDNTVSGLKIFNVGSSTGNTITFSVDFDFKKPRNLFASPGNTSVMLEWDAPDITDPNNLLTGYNVYRDGVLISDPVNCIPGRTFLDQNLTNGVTYQYHVTAVYDYLSGESPASNQVAARPFITEFEVILASFDSNNFPFVHADVLIKEGGRTINSRSYPTDFGDLNFYIYENGVRQTHYVNIIPPEEGGGSRMADIVFIMDNSGSMSDEQNAIRQNMITFVNNLQDAGVNFALGLCRYGQGAGNGSPMFEDNGQLTTNAEYFKNSVWTRNVVDGGNEPGYQAISQTASGFSFRPGAQKIIIIITDETPDQGGASMAQAQNACVNNSITLFALTEGGLYGTFQPIATATGGAVFNIYSNFDAILQAISDQISSTFHISYRSSVPVFNAMERNVEYYVTNGVNHNSCFGSYTPGASPIILRTLQTMLLEGLSTRVNTPFPIKAYIFDDVDPKVTGATIFYRKTGTVAYSQMPMQKVSGDLWQANVPGVPDTGLDYYIRATDGQATSSSPTHDPTVKPYQLPVFPARPLQIVINPNPAGRDNSIDISVSITPQEYIKVSEDAVQLHFRKIGTLLFNSVNMQNTGGSIYSATIPEEFNTEDGVEYYISATSIWEITRNSDTQSIGGTLPVIDLYPPQNLAVYVEMNSILLTWDPHPDEIFCRGYIVYRNGEDISGIITDRYYLDNTFASGHETTYQVVAIYNLITESEPCEPVTVMPGMIIGQGDITNTAQQAAPVNIHSKSLKGQMVYTKAEINALGFYGPGVLSAIGFRSFMAPLYSIPNYTVRVKHTTAENVAAHDPGPFESESVVDLYQPHVGWSMLSLENPFVWNGMDNILIDVSFGMLPAFHDSGRQYWYETPNGFRYKRSDGVNMTDINEVTTVVNDLKPQIMIGLNAIGQDQVPTPENLIARYGDSRVNLGWEIPVRSTRDLPYNFKIFRNNALLATTNNPFYDDFNVINGQQYIYYVKTVDPQSGIESAPSNLVVAKPNELHFVKIWENAPEHQMLFNITGAIADNIVLDDGDEIGIFDMNNCVGAVKLTDPITNPLAVIAGDYVENHSFNFRLWKSETLTEYMNVTFNHLDPNATQTTFINDSEVTLGLQGEASPGASQSIALMPGWNMISTNIIPFNPNIQGLFIDLINNGNLIKVQDQTGQSLENAGGLGWINNIGNLQNTEGYKVRLNNPYLLPLQGNTITLPLDIPLSAGWNIVSYPYDFELDAQQIFGDLITNNLLVKVQSESGQSYENIPGLGWLNFIGNMKPKKAYAIKVSQECLLHYPEVSNPVAMAVKKSIPTAERQTSHFEKVWTGNGWQHFNIYIPVTAEITGNLHDGDEIAVFDGEYCVGSAFYDAGREFISIPSSMIDEYDENTNGYTPGNGYSFKIWSAQNLSESQHIAYELLSGSPVFASNGTAIVELNSLALSLENSTPIVTKINSIYPNPFNPETNIKYSVQKEGKISLEVYNVKGQKVRTLFSGHQKAGEYQLVWNGLNQSGKKVASGIYFARLQTPDKQVIKKMLLMK